MSFRFGPFELDPHAGELRRAGTPVPIQPKPFALLLLLVEQRERVVPQDELLEALWPGTIVTSGSLTRAISVARRAIEDTHKAARIRSFPRRGYRFMGEVTETGAVPTAPVDAPIPRDGQVLAPGDVDTRIEDVFVGRDEALARLHQSWTSSQASTGRVALISGSAGMGKTRLVEVFARQAREQGALVVFGKSCDGEGVPAFWLWSEVLRELREIGHEALAGGIEGLLEKAGKETDAEQRFRFFSAVDLALTEASLARPIVIVLEDLQWARSPSLRLLEHITFELRDSHLFFVGTIRDEPRERQHDVERSLAVLRRTEDCEDIVLGGLSRGDVGRFLGEVIGRPAPSELTSELFARTEGVPLFVHEAVRLLDERGELRYPEHIRRQGINLPRHAVDLIRRSLDGLSRDCADLVAAAAVLGRQFTVRLVASVAQIDPSEAMDLLEEALMAGIVKEMEDAAATYHFCHALFQEEAYAALKAGKRARLHARAVEILERQHAESPERVIAELAHHHHESIAVGDPERAFTCAIAAANEAARLLAHEQAAAHYAQAVEAIEHFEIAAPDRRLATLIELGEAHRRAGDRRRRRDVSIQAMESAQSLGRNHEYALAAIRFCDINEWSPEDNAAEQAIDNALAAVSDDTEDAISLRARLTARRAYLDIRHAGSQETAQHAVALARESSDPETIQEALYVLIYSLAGPDHIPERRALGQELHAAALQLRSRETAVIAVLDVACDYLSLEDPDSAEATRQEVEALADDHPSPGILWHTRLFDTGRKLLTGDIHGVDQEISDVLLLGKRLDHPYAQACHNAQRMQLHRYLGEHAAIPPLFARAAKSTLGSNHWARAVSARAELQLGNEATARKTWDGLAVADFDDIERGIRWIGTVIELAHLCADLEDSAHAQSFIFLLTPAAHMHGVLPMPIVYGGPATYALARLHEVLGLADPAIEYYELAIASAERMNARPVQARVMLDAARALARRGDAMRARELEQRAAVLVAETGCRL